MCYPDLMTSSDDLATCLDAGTNADLKTGNWSAESADKNRNGMGGVVKDNITNLQADPKHRTPYVCNAGNEPTPENLMELGPLPAERPDRGLRKP